MARAFVADVDDILLTGTNLHESRQALKSAQHCPHCWSTAGVYPHDSGQWQSSTEDEIIALVNQSEVVAIGECGLDFDRNSPTPQEQERAFEAQLRIAIELQTPIFIHCRDAHECFLTLLGPWLDSPPGVVLHCFTEVRQKIQGCVSRGLYIGTTGWVCDERRGIELRELLPFIPVEKLLIKTDTSHLPPRDLTPKPVLRRDGSAHLPHILECIARWREENPQ